MDFLRGFMCKRCSAVQWDEWFQEFHAQVELTKSVDQLQSSWCPACRVIGRGIAHWGRPISQLRRNGNSIDVGFGAGSYQRSDLKLYDKDDEDFVKACRVHPKRIDFANARDDIRCCFSRHEECNAQLGSALHNLKVLDCYYRVVIPAPEHCEYVALSYVWGKAGLQDAPDLPRIPDILPRTLEDSIKATILLGYRYLWIDRYCVDQHDPVARQHQINQMGNIYSSSQVTIIAATGTLGRNSDVTSGLRGITDDFKTPSSCAVTDRLRLVHTRQSMRTSIVMSAWFSRGWTFQEGYLSRRRMYFTDVGVKYICDDPHVYYWSGFANEFAATLRSSTKQALFKYKEQMMHEYTGRHLTNDHDALNAIIGALEAQDADHTWAVNIAIEDSRTFFFLHWKHLSPVPRRKEFPSWSPIGWRGQAQYIAGRPSLSHTCLVDVWRDGSYTAMSQSVGRLRLQHHLPVEEPSKFLKLTTLVLKLEFIQVESRGQSRPAGLYVRVPYSPTLDVFVLPYWDIEEAIEPAEDGRIELPCVVVVQDEHRVFMGNQRFEDEMQILILRQHDGYYERVGCFAWEEGNVRGFAYDDHGCEFMSPMYVRRFRGEEDGKYWLENGVETTLLLG